MQMHPGPIATLTRLVQINSVNPKLSPGAPGEATIAKYIAKALQHPNVSVQLLEPEPNRMTAVATVKGTGGGRSLMLNGHIDTVGVDGMPEPFSGAIRDGKLYGRGSYDMKGSVAACIAALLAIADAPPRGDVVLAAVADEEYGSLGTTDLLRHVRTDAAIVTEPTALDICLAHKGYLWIEVETKGRAAHGSRYELGIDANMRMGRFLARLDLLEQELRARPPHPLVGPPSLHAAMLSGGSGLSTYAASCKLQIERRTIPGETESSVMHEFESLLDPSMEATVRPYFVRDPFEVSADAPIVQAAIRARGGEAAIVGDTPWMDAALLKAAGIETVVLGPRGAGAHAAEEWVDVESVEQLARILHAIALDYCA
jgi:acetylornithine deacetylase